MTETCVCGMNGGHTKELHRIGGCSGSHEDHVRAGRIGARKMNETWGKTPEAHEARARGGRIGGHKVVESGQLASIASKGGHALAQRERADPDFCAKLRKGRARGARARTEHERTDPDFRAKQQDARSRAGRIGGCITARTLSHKRPTWPEVRFYGLVLGDPTIAPGFTAQQSDGHGIYDGAWLGQHIIAELDGGGHFAFNPGAQKAKDIQKNIMRMLDYNTVLREEDENMLFLKALAILTEESP